MIFRGASFENLEQIFFFVQTQTREISKSNILVSYNALYTLVISVFHPLMEFFFNLEIIYSVCTLRLTVDLWKVENFFIAGIFHVALKLTAICI